MKLLIAAAVIIVLALLLGIRRNTVGDYLHFFAVLLSAAGAYFIALAKADTAAAFAAEKLKLDIAAYPLSAKIAAAAAGPALFAASFILLFIVIGLIFHFLAKISKREKKSIFAKLVINALAGVVIAACLLTPAVYYPSRAGKTAEIADRAGIDLGTKLPQMVSSIEVPEYLNIITAPFGHFVYKDQKYTVDDSIQAADFLSGLLQEPYETDRLIEQHNEILKDEKLDILCGDLTEELMDNNTAEPLRSIMKRPAKLSTKLRAAIIDLLLNETLSRKVDKKIPLGKLIDLADEESCSIAIDSLNDDVLSQYTANYKEYGPVIKQLLTSIPKAKGEHSAIGAIDAAEMESVMGLIQSRVNGSTPKKTDEDKLYRAITRSAVIRELIVTATEGGSKIDPWGIGSSFGKELSLSLMERLENTKNFTLDELTKKSIKAFLGIQ